MTDEELRSLVAAKMEEIDAQGMKDFGRVMKAVMSEVGSRAEGAIVSATVREVINGR